MLYTENTDFSEERSWTISIFTENEPGLLGRVTQIFTRRKMNIDSIAASESEVKDVYRYTIVTHCQADRAIKVVKQIEKMVGVFRAFLHDETTTVFQEIALYKIRTEQLTSGNHKVEKLIRKHHARILTIEPEFTVIEKTGHKEETQALLDELEPIGVLEFVRSGRVAITKPMNFLSEYLHKVEKQERFELEN